MKQGTQFALPVEIGMSLDEVSRIEFVFKQKSCKGFPAIKSNVWPDDCTRQEGQNIILIPWTREDAYKFMGGDTLYMDTRITLRDSTNPLNWLDHDFETASSAVKLGSYSSVQHAKEVECMNYAIDVSKHQGKFDWQVAYNKGIRHAMLRAGYGRYSSQVDPQFGRNAAECARLGIQYGVYWYSYASTPAEARQEARCCLAAIQGKHLCLPVAYDIEYEPCILRLTNAQRTALVQAFLSEIEAAGYYGILYASCDFIRNRLDWKALSKYDVWVAQYSSACTCPLPYGIWQYSSRNALGIPGYGTSLDCNRVYKDYEQLMIQAGLQGHTAPQPEDTSPNKLDKQRITIGRISSGDRSTIRALCEGLGLIAAGLYRETCADSNQWVLDIGPVSSGDAWYIMRKCTELQLIDAGLYKSEYVE